MTGVQSSNRTSAELLQAATLGLGRDSRMHQKANSVCMQNMEMQYVLFVRVGKRRREHSQKTDTRNKGRNGRVPIALFVVLGRPGDLQLPIKHIYSA